MSSIELQSHYSSKLQAMFFPYIKAIFSRIIFWDQIDGSFKKILLVIIFLAIQTLFPLDYGVIFFNKGLE